MDIIVFSKADLKTDGTFKKRNDIKVMDQEHFEDYLKLNNLKVSYGYIDSVGQISNGLFFRCYSNGFRIGVSGLVKHINNEKVVNNAY